MVGADHSRPVWAEPCGMTKAISKQLNLWLINKKCHINFLPITLRGRAREEQVSKTSQFK